MHFSNRWSTYIKANLDNISSDTFSRLFKYETKGGILNDGSLEDVVDHLVLHHDSEIPNPYDSIGTTYGIHVLDDYINTYMPKDPEAIP